MEAACQVVALARDIGLMGQGDVDDWLARFAAGRHGPPDPVPAEEDPVVLRAFLGVVWHRHESGQVPRERYFPTAMTPVEAKRAAGMLDGGLLDAYRFALRGYECLGHETSREARYLVSLADTWRYEHDDDLVDVGRMCDVLSLFSYFLHMYRGYRLDDVAGWPAQSARSERRNAFLARDGAASFTAAIDVWRAEQADPDAFGC